MFSRDADSAASGSRRKLGSLGVSITLHGLVIGIMVVVPLVFSDCGLVEANSVGPNTMVADLSYTPWPGDPEQTQSQPNTLHIPDPEIVRLHPDSASRIPHAITASAEALHLPPIMGPLSMVPSMDFGYHGACGCQPQHMDRPPKSQAERPILIMRVDPVYPFIARRDGIHGNVVVNATIDREGVVTNITVISGPPLLRGAVIDAVRQWRYRPYLLNGVPVEVETTITVNFGLHDSAGRIL